MNHILSSLLVIAALFAFAGGSGSQRKQTSAFVCNINTLTAEERKDLTETIDRLLTAARSGRELPNGYEVRFDDPCLFPAAAKWIEYEHRCCSFFDITISLTRNNGPMIVRLTGEKGVKEFLAADLPKLKDLVSAKG